MHINTFDHFQQGKSFIHKLDPRAKLIAVILFVVSNVLLPDGLWLAFIGSWALVAAGAYAADVSVAFVLKRALIALPFAMAAITLVFTLPGRPLFGIEIGSWLLIATEEGLVRFTSILLRSWISVQMAILLTATTPFPDLVHGMRHLKVPSILISIIAFMYRYIFVLADETMRLLRARESRSAGLGGHKTGGSLRWRAGVAGNMAGQLFLRSYERSDRVYNAMLSRGYRGELMTMNPHVIRRTDWIFLSTFIAFLTTLQLFSHLLP